MKKTLFFVGIITATFTIMNCCLCRQARQIVTEESVVELQTVEKSNSITATRWKLVEINGKPISEMTFATEPFIEFDEATNRVSGSGGCNNFSGEMEIDEPTKRIRFSKMISTQKTCIDMTIESQLMKILSVVDNYSINGNSLSLNRARMAPLARFERVE